MDGYRVDGAKLRSIRERKLWLQKDLAAAAGTTVKHVGRIERGTNQPKGIWVHRVANALGVEFTEFCDPVGTAAELLGSSPA